MFRGGVARVPLVLLLVVAPLAIGAIPGGGVHASGIAAQSNVDADTVLLDVELEPNGTARWEISYRVRLADDNETAAFESLARDVEANRSAYERRFAERIAGTVAAAENATDREMVARNVTVRTARQEIPQRYGVLVYAFEWTGFASVDGTTLRAGDAIGGLFLDEATTLTIGWPEGYAPTRVDPEGDDRDDRSVTWRGPAEFTTDQPRLVVSTAPPTTTEPTRTPDPTETSNGPAGTDLATLVVVAGLAALLSLFGAAWWWRRGQPWDGGPPSGTTTREPPDELLSNEERVLRLVEEHGGRMKQQQVVEELGWTDAKTSQVVGDLRESGELEGFRLGRENVLRLPEDDGTEP